MTLNQKPQKLPSDILERGIKTNDIQLLKDWGKYLATSVEKESTAMTTTQLRKFFGEIKRLQADEFDKIKGEIILLDPRIAYSTGRADKKSKIKDFYPLISPLLNDIKEDEKKFKNFVNIVESIVAYHKANNGD